MAHAAHARLLELLALDGEAGRALLLLLAILARLLPWVWVTPALGSRLIPRTARAAVALALAICCYPPVAAAAGAAPLAPLMLLGEVGVGLTLGFVTSLVFYAAQSAGAAMDVARGASSGEVYLPQSGDRASPLASLAFQFAIVLFFALGGHRLVVSLVVQSYHVLPLGGISATSGFGALALHAARLTGDVLLLAVAWAAPVLAATLLADIALGWVNRFVPQLNVFFLAMPIKALLGISVMVLGASLLAAALPEGLAQGVAAVERTLELMSGK